MMDRGDSTTSLADVPDIVRKPSAAKLPLIDSVGSAIVKAYDRCDDPEGRVEHNYMQCHVEKMHTSEGRVIRSVWSQKRL